MDRQVPLAFLLSLVQAALFICRKFWLTDQLHRGCPSMLFPLTQHAVSSLILPVISWAGWQWAVDALCTFVLLCIVTRHVRVHHFHPRTGVTEERVPMCQSSPSSGGHLVQMQCPELAHGHEAKSKIPLWSELQAPEWLLRRAGLSWCYLKDCAVRLGGSALPYPEHHHLLQALAVLDWPQRLERWHLLRISLAQQIHFEVPKVKLANKCVYMSSNAVSVYWS